MNGNGPKTHQIAILRPLLACNRGGYYTLEVVSEIRFEVRKTPNRGILEISPKARPSPGGIHEKTDFLDLALKWGFGVYMALLGLRKMELGQNRTSNHPNGISLYGL